MVNYGHIKMPTVDPVQRKIQRILDLSLAAMLWYSFNSRPVDFCESEVADKSLARFDALQTKHSW